MQDMASWARDGVADLQSVLLYLSLTGPVQCLREAWLVTALLFPFDQLELT